MTSSLSRSTIFSTFKGCIEGICNFPLPIHASRHTHAVRPLEAGADLEFVQERLGNGLCKLHRTYSKEIAARLIN